MTAAVATSDPRSVAAAAAVLRTGGNAVDAAVTAAFVAYVIEPHWCGIGGDGFLFVHQGSGPPIALDGSGAVPAGLTPDALAADGHPGVPARGGPSTTPPGAVALLETALERFGTISLADAVAPAATVARDGFTVRASLARAAAGAAATLADDPVLGPLYSPTGNGVAEGDEIHNPRLADALDLIATEGSDAILRGPLADAIVETVSADGGYLSAADLDAHHTTEITPQSVDFAAHQVWEFPSPTQGPAVLAALEAVNDLAAGDTPDWVAVLAAMRAGMASAGFDPAKVMTGRPSPSKGDTSYLAVIDHDGMTASLITSVFGDFGAHLGVAALGGPVGNRATTFRMLQQPPRPGKPPHTTIPAVVTHDGNLAYALGVAGGMMQPQAQVQLLVRMLIEGYTPQAAIDAPRFKICFGGGLAIEAGHELADPHPEALEHPAGPEGFGGAQAAGFHQGQLLAGADARRGGDSTVID